MREGGKEGRDERRRYRSGMLTHLSSLPFLLPSLLPSFLSIPLADNARKLLFSTSLSPPAHTVLSLSHPVLHLLPMLQPPPVLRLLLVMVVGIATFHKKTEAVTSSRTLSLPLFLPPSLLPLLLLHLIDAGGSLLGEGRLLSSLPPSLLPSLPPSLPLPHPLLFQATSPV